MLNSLDYKRINIHITNDCNLDCGICFENKDREKPNYLAQEDIFNFIDDINPYHIGLVGGEPLLHPEINSIIRGLKERGVDICLVTNGLLLDKLTEMPDSLSIGVSNNRPNEVADKFLAEHPEMLGRTEITITPTVLSKIDSIIEKYSTLGVNRINISLLSFWDFKPEVKEFITDEYVEKLIELASDERYQKYNIVFFGEDDLGCLRDYYNEIVPENVEFECIAPLNIFSDGHLEFCDLEYFPLQMTIKDYDQDKLVKNWQLREQCKYCSLRRKKKN